MPSASVGPASNSVSLCSLANCVITVGLSDIWPKVIEVSYVNINHMSLLVTVDNWTPNVLVQHVSNNFVVTKTANINSKNSSVSNTHNLMA